MTLGNSPQPLTRRQLRELAREHEPASADAGQSAQSTTDSSAQSIVPDPPTPLSTSPGHTADATDESHESRHTAPPVDGGSSQRSSAGAAPAPLPIPEVFEPADTGRTLSRRELRALQAASASSGDDAVDTSTEDRVAATPDPRVDPAPEVVSAGAARAAAPGIGLHPPIGHWSVDREDDGHVHAIGHQEEEQSFDDLVGRGVGSGGIPTTSNALILPSIPRQGAAGPITSTGEIMITGSIDLPRSLGATGQHPNLFDSSEMDRMLDQLDEDSNHNDVAPVSASRAVSTHTSTRGVMTPPRKRGASLPTILAITAAVLAIGVLSLFVVGYAFHIY